MWASFWHHWDTGQKKRSFSHDCKHFPTLSQAYCVSDERLWNFSSQIVKTKLLLEHLWHVKFFFGVSFWDRFPRVLSLSLGETASLWHPLRGGLACNLLRAVVWKPNGKHYGVGLCQTWLEPKPERTSRDAGITPLCLGGRGSEKWSLELSFPSRIHPHNLWDPGSKIIKCFKIETAEC